MHIEERITEIEKRLDAIQNKFTLMHESVQQLILHATMNAEAIVEHIAQLDSEKEEVIQEYRDELAHILREHSKK